MQYHIEFSFPLTINKLTLGCFHLSWCKISAIANLPNLDVLKLLHEAFEGEIWNMDVEKFPKVSFLKLSLLDIVKWTASECENHFPPLQKLALKNCSLEEIPSSLGNISTLEIIEVLNFSDSTASSIMAIQELPLKILISGADLQRRH